MSAVNQYLLTGAGFTKNFGGYLSQEMWARVFNYPRVQEVPPLRSLLLAETDFESIYRVVLNGSNDLCKEVFSAALLAAYQQMDDAIRDFSFVPGSRYPVNINQVQRLLAVFAGPIGHLGYIFTLNQDLFLERCYFNGPKPVLPGVRQLSDWFTTHYNTALELSAFVEIVEKDRLEIVKTEYKKHHQLAYFKLHGSCNWRAREGTTHMVVGRDKISQVGRHYLLEWYLQVFNLCLAEPDSRLLIIGYGFADSHINQVLADAILKHGLSIYILDPTPSDQLRERIQSAPWGQTILEGTRAFYSFTLWDLFPERQEETSDWRTIQEVFFGGRLS